MPYLTVSALLAMLVPVPLVLRRFEGGGGGTPTKKADSDSD